MNACRFVLTLPTLNRYQRRAHRHAGVPTPVRVDLRQTQTERETYLYTQREKEAGLHGYRRVRVFGSWHVGAQRYSLL